MSTDVIDGTAAEIVPARVAHEVLVPLDVGAQRDAMRAYQEGLRQLLDKSDWQQTGKEEFVKKSGWRKIAAWFSLSIELVHDDVDRASDGSVERARTWARAIAPNGRYADGDGYCDVSESRFARNRAKLENDLRGTATTRAINRAISNLVGMGAVSHEEMVTADGGPRFGPEASEAQAAQLHRATAYALDGRVGLVDGVIRDIQAKAGGYLPAIAVQAVGLMAGAVKRAREAQNQDDPPSDEGAGLTTEGVAQPSKQDGSSAHRTETVLDAQVDAALRAREDIAP